MAQLVEHRTLNPVVEGSSPSGPTTLHSIPVCTLGAKCGELPALALKYGTHWEQVRQACQPFGRAIELESYAGL